MGVATIEKKVLLAGLEAGGYGVDPVLTAADAIYPDEADVSLAIAVVDVPISDTFDDPVSGPEIGNKMPDLTMSLPLVCGGAGAVCDQVDLLLQASGYVRTGAGPYVYSWDPPNASSARLELEKNGLRYQLSGARCAWSLPAVPGERAIFDAQAMGLWIVPDGQDMTAATATRYPAIICESLALDPYSDGVGVGSGLYISSATISDRGQLYRLMDTNSAEGVGEVAILGKGSGKDRGTTVEIEYTRPTGPDSDEWWARFLDKTLTGVFSATFTGPNGGTWVFAFKRAQIVAHEDAVVGDVHAGKATLKALRSVAGAANDALIITYTAPV